MAAGHSCHYSSRVRSGTPSSISSLSKAAKKEAAETRCTIIGIMLLGVCRELAEQHTCHTKRAEAVA